MSTKKVRQLLATVLSLVMILSLVVVPAAAAEGDLTGAVNDTWSFINSDFAGGVTAYKGLTFSQSLTKNGDQHGVDMKSATITIPVQGDCNIEVVPSYKWNLTIGSETYADAPNAENTTPVVFHYQGAAGTVNLVANSQTYLRSIAIKDYSAPAPSVTIAKEALAVVGTEASVDVALANAPAGQEVTWTATPADTSIVASAAVADGKLTFTPAAAGKTEIDVKATVGGSDYTGKIPVFARPATQSELSGTALTFTNETLYKTTGETLWSGALNWNGVQHGATAAVGDTLTLKVPAGKKATLVVSTCQFGAGTAATVTATSDGTDLTVTSDVTKTAVGDNAAGGEFTIADATGTVVLTFGSTNTQHSLFIHGIAVTLADYVAPGADGIILDTDAVNVKTGKTATATATISGYAGKTFFAISADETKATVAAADGAEGVKTLTISGVAATTEAVNIYVGMADATPADATAAAAVEGVKTIAVTVTDPVVSDGKVDVWDFGAEELDATKFNNKLTIPEMNSWYTNPPKPGEADSNNQLGSFTSTTGIAFDGAGKTNHRLRSDTEGLTRRDEKTLKGDGKDPYVPNTTETAEDGTETSVAEVYHGYLYSNAGSTPAVKLSLAGVNKGDKLTYIVSSNGKDATYFLENDAGWSVKDKFTAGGPAKTMTFYPPADGTYSLYCTDEKLVVGRIYREVGTVVTVSGAVTVPADKTMPEGWKLVFTDDLNGSVEEVTVTGGSYTVDLYQGHSYALSLKGADEFVVKTGATLDLTAEEATEKTHPVEIEAVPMAVTTVTVSGVGAIVPAASAKLVFTPAGADAIYQPPKLNVANGDQTVNLEKGRTYTASLINANDYSVKSTTPAEIKFDGDTAALTVELEPVATYKVTIEPTGLTLADLADATFTFTNISETYPNADGEPESYTYTFTGPDAIMLRDGQYAVKVATTKGRQKLTPDVKVNGAAATRSIAFETDITSWDFSDPDWTDAAATSGSWYGLTFTGVSKDKTYAKGGAATTINVPVSGPCKVAVSYCYQATGTVGDVAFSTASGSTSTIETTTYNYTGTAGNVAIATTASTYITKIEIFQDAVPYVATIAVGADKDYKTINAALDAVRKMDRPNGERVTIVIDPGTYEEQVKVDVPNVTFKNAKADAAKLELKNKGVDIGENEVRITWYYGQFHDYYSMTPGGWFDADVMAVNQENGYLTYHNVGGSQGTLWTSTVTVMADGFEAEGIIFENSYNQYVSAAAVKDTIVPTMKGMFDYTGAQVGDTTVQKKAHVGQAAAVGMDKGVQKSYFDNCAFIGHQDVIYGGEGATAAFYNCDAFGACDYIFGNMTAVFAKCDLVLNVGADDDKNDVAYITAPRNSANVRGYLMYNCNIRTVVPGTENAGTAITAQQHGLGRPWAAGTGEAVFYETTVGVNKDGKSLIFDEGWNNGLSGASNFCAEYHTHETAETYDHSKRIDGGVLTEAKTSDGASLDDYAGWLGGWDPFVGKDMEIVCPDAAPVETVTVTAPAAEVAAGGTVALTAAVEPEGANQKVTWTTSDETIATVDAEGVVTGVAAGKVTITATSAGKNAAGEAVTGTVELTVVAPADALAAAIKAAQAELDNTLVSEDGADVSKRDVWTTQPVRDTMQDALDAAKAVAEKEGVTAAELIAATDTLKDATADFVAAQKEGTKSNPSRPSIGTTTRPGVTKTETSTNDKGDVATTTTNSDGDKTITVVNADGETVAEIKLPASIPTPTTKFKDVPEGHWAEESINHMAGLGMVNGVNEAHDIFDMESTMTRASVATMFFRLSNGKTGIASTFEDVAEGQWYTDAIGWAAKTGVVTGYSETAFGPDDTITRQQLAVMLQRYANLIGMDAKAHASALDPFVDGAEADDWAVEGLAWCVKNGIMKGRGGDVLDPTAEITRAEATAMFDRMIALMQK